MFVVYIGNIFKNTKPVKKKKDTITRMKTSHRLENTYLIKDLYPKYTKNS